jgi:hypothetical protein
MHAHIEVTETNCEMDQTIGQGDIRLEATRAVPIIEDISNEVNVLQEACQPLYLGVLSTMLASTLLLMNICMVHGVLNKYTNQLLTLFHRYLLPKNNWLRLQEHPCLCKWVCYI